MIINSIQNNGFTKLTESVENQNLPLSTSDPKGIGTITQVFNEVVAEKSKFIEGDFLTNDEDDFDKTIQSKKFPLAKERMQKTMQADWKLVQEAYKRAELIEQTVPLKSLTPEEEKKFQMLSSQGFEGQNNLLRRAIISSDYKAFIRTCLDSEDGSWRHQQDPKTLKSWVHLATESWQPEILYFLLLQGTDLDLVDKNGLTLCQQARNKGRKDITDFIDGCQFFIEYQKNPSDPLKEKIESIDPEVKTTLEDISHRVEEYIKAYKDLQASYFSEDGKLTDEGKIKKDVAKHGYVRHQEGSQGHNGLIIESIVEGNLEQLVTHVKGGASLDTLSTGWQKVIQNPHAFGLSYWNFVQESMRSFQQEMQETFLGEDPTLWDRNLGVGKSLLDMAVMYSSEKQDNLEIIAYFIHKGLDPFRTNDGGDSPFSMALIKGNLKAALLMMGYKNISEENIPKIDEETLGKAFLILKEGAKMRDPLYIKSSKKRDAFFAAALLLSNQGIQEINGILNLIHMFSLFHSVFMGDRLTFREKLNLKPESLYFPEVIKQISPIISQASILEIAIRPQYPIGRLASTALSVYANVQSTFESLKIAYSHVRERPIDAFCKVGADALSTARDMVFFKNYFSSLVYKPITNWLDPQDPLQYKAANITERLDCPKLDAGNKNDAKIILSDKWDQAAFEKDPTEYLLGLAKDIDKDSQFRARFSKLNEACHTLQEVSLLRDTAIKAGMIFTGALMNFEKWEPLARASIFYLVSSGILRQILT